MAARENPLLEVLEPARRERRVRREENPLLDLVEEAKPSVGREVLGELASGFVRGLRQAAAAPFEVAEMAAGVGGDVGRAIAGPPAPDDRTLVGAIREGDPREIARMVARRAGEAVGSTLPVLLTGGAGYLLGGIRVGAALGAGTAFTQQLAETAGELQQETGSPRWELAVPTAAVQTALDVLTPAAVARRFGIKLGSARALVRALKDTAPIFMAKAAGREGLTEAMQELLTVGVARAAADKEFSPEDAERILEAGLSGALGGMVFGLAPRRGRVAPALEAAGEERQLPTPGERVELDLEQIPVLATYSFEPPDAEGITVGLSPAEAALQEARSEGGPTRPIYWIRDAEDFIPAPAVAEWALENGLVEGPGVRKLEEALGPRPDPEAAKEALRLGLRWKVPREALKTAGIWVARNPELVEVPALPLHHFYATKGLGGTRALDLAEAPTSTNPQVVQFLFDYDWRAKGTVTDARALILKPDGTVEVGSLRAAPSGAVAIPLAPFGAAPREVLSTRRKKSGLERLVRKGDFPSWKEIEPADRFSTQVDPGIDVQQANEILEMVRQALADYEKVFGLRLPIRKVYVTTFVEPSYGTYNPAEQRIKINLSRHPSKDEILDTIYHELAHAAAHALALNKPKGTAPAVLHAWNRWVQERVSVQGSEEGLAISHNWSTRGSMGPHLVNWFDFQEFLATSFARAVARRGSAQGEFAALLRARIEQVLQNSPIAARVDAFMERFAEWLRTGGGIELLLEARRADGEERGYTWPRVGIDEEVKKLAIPASETPEEANASAAEADRWAWWMEWGINIQQLARLNPHIQGLGRFLDLLRSWQRRKTEMVLLGDEALREWYRLGKEERERVGNYLTLATVFGENDPLVRDLWQRLSDDEVAVVRQVRGVLAEVLNRFEAVIISNLEKRIADEEVRAQRIAEVRAEFERIRKEGAYFPLKRFGDLTIEVRSEEGKVVYFATFERESERRAALAEIRELYPPSEGWTITTGKLPKHARNWLGLSPVVLRQLLESIPNLTQEQREAIEKLVAYHIPQRSFRKHFLRRRRIPGFSKDAPRVFASYMLAASNALARMEYADQLREAIMQTEAEVRGRPGDITARIRIADFMRELFDYLMEPQTEWWQLRTFAFIWYLGFNVKSAFVNLTQPFVFTYPYLAARFGSDAAALAALRRGFARATRSFRDEGALTELERKALDFLTRQGILDQSLAAELAAAAQGGLASKLAGSAAGRLLQGFADTASWLFHNAERLNRRAVALAALDAARRKGISAAYADHLMSIYRAQYDALRAEGLPSRDALAILAALDANDTTMFDYSAYNRPKLFRGRKSAFLIFMTFVQNMLWFERYAPGRGRHLLLLFALAGLMGLPGAEDIDDLIAALARLAGIEFRPSTEVRQLVAAAGGDPELLLHGIARKGLGLGLIGSIVGVPLPEVDLSASLSAGRIVPGMRPLAETLMGREPALARGLEELSGAGLAIFFRTMQAFLSEEPDGWKQMEAGMPVALRNLSRAIRYGLRGEETTRSGAAIVEFDPEDPWTTVELGLLALGFQPARLSRAYEEIGVRAEVAQYWLGRRQALLSALAWARKRTPRERREVIEDIRAFNRDVPYPGLRITSETLRRSLRGRLRRERLLEEQGAATRQLIPIARDIARLFPERRRGEQADL